MIESNDLSLEYVLTFDNRESATSKAQIALSFIEDSHNLAEYAAFFQWLGERLADGDIEFNNIIFENMRLNKSSARLLSLWLMRVVN